MFGPVGVWHGGDIGRGVDFGEAFGPIPEGSTSTAEAGTRVEHRRLVGSLRSMCRGRSSAAGRRLIKARRLAAVVKLCSGAQEAEVRGVRRRSGVSAHGSEDLMVGEGNANPTTAKRRRLTR
jgi:hypothetical protein